MPSMPGMRTAASSAARSAKRVLVRTVLYAALLSMTATLLVAVAVAPGPRTRSLGRARLASSSTSGLVVKVGYVDTVNGGKSVIPSPWYQSPGVTYFNCADGNGGNCTSSHAASVTDAGAILLHNPSANTSSITVDGVAAGVYLADGAGPDTGYQQTDNCFTWGPASTSTQSSVINNLCGLNTYMGNLWYSSTAAMASFTVSPGDTAILTGYGSWFDTSYAGSFESACNSASLDLPGALGIVAVTTGTTTMTTKKYYDHGGILAAGGPPRHRDGCANASNEGSQWTMTSTVPPYPVGGPVSRANLYGGCNALLSCSAGTMPVHHNTNHPVDTASGDLHVGVSGFSVPALGHSLDFGLSYDSMQIQQEISAGTDVDNDGDAGKDTDGEDGDGNYAGPFGWGWSMTNAPVLAVPGPYGSGGVIAIQGNGAQTDFVPPVTSSVGAASCPSPDVFAGTSTTFCALPRVTAGTLTFDSSRRSPYVPYVLSEKGGLATFGFTGAGQLSYEATSSEPGSRLEVKTSVSPGSGGCPSAATYTWLSFCTVYVASSGASMAIGMDANGIAQAVFDPSGAVWSLGYDSSVNLTSVTDPAGRKTSFTYDTGNAAPSLQHDLCSKTEPSGNAAGTAPTSCPSANYNMSPTCPTGTSCYTYQTHYPNNSVWSPASSIDSSTKINSVSCPSRDFCVAVDSSGNALTYDGTSWSSPTLIDSGNSLNSISCATSTSCVAVDSSGNALTYDGTSWSSPSSSSIDGTNSLTSVSCVGTGFCVAVDSAGNALSLNGSSWSTTSIDGTNSLTSVSCVSSKFCAAVDSAGNALTYNGTSWSSPSSIDPSTKINSISCVSSSICVAVDSKGSVLTYNGTSWTATTIDSGNSLTSISCADHTFCAAVDSAGNALTYNGTTGLTTVLGNGSLTAVSCPEATYCSAVDSSGYAFSYNSTARVAQYVDPMGYKTTFAYAGNRNTAIGSWTSITKANGDVSKYSYVYGELVAKTSFGSNAQVGLQQNTNPATTLYVRDPSTLLANSRTGPDGNTTTYAYDANGNLCWSAPYAVSSPTCGSPPAAITNPPAGPTVYTYNSLGEVTSSTDPMGNVTTSIYDANGNLCWSVPWKVSLTSLCGSPPAATSSAGPTVYTYNSLGERSTMTNPDGNTTTYAYDANGNLCWSVPWGG